MKTSRWLIILVVLVVILAGIQWIMNSQSSSSFNQYGNPTASSTDQTGAVASASPDAGVTAPTGSVSNKNLMHTVTIVTSKGTIVFQTYDADAPKTVQNFITLADKGFFNGLIFHRVIDGFMIQGGDPTGTGRGGPGYQFADELDPNTASYQGGYMRGTVAMANAGPNTNGSQFFIMQKDTPALPHNYTIFGKVISGLDVVDAIAKAPRDANDRPLTPITMTKVTETAAQ